MIAIVIKHTFNHDNMKIGKSSLIKNFNINRDVYLICVQIIIIRIQNNEYINMR